MEKSLPGIDAYKKCFDEFSSRESREKKEFRTKSYDAICEYPKEKKDCIAKDIISFYESLKIEKKAFQKKY